MLPPMLPDPESAPIPGAELTRISRIEIENLSIIFVNLNVSVEISP
jgi:hypothetical protein